MFDWQLSSDSDRTNGPVVSSYFWIFWAVVVPLTILVAIAWRVWWLWEKRHLDRDVLLEIEGIDDPAYLDVKKEKGFARGSPFLGGATFKSGLESLRKRPVGQ